MYQFFVSPEQIMENEVVITGSDVNHIKNVLRMRPGEEICVSDGTDKKEYRCRIEELGMEEIRCSLCFVKESDIELSSRVFLLQGLPKADKMEWIVQKAVELGVYAVIPVACKRSVVKLDDKKEKSKHIRWNTIAESAAKQSKRKIIPEVLPVMTMKEAVLKAAECEIRMIPYELAKGMADTKQIFDHLEPGKDIAVFIGPEGGFAEEEIQLAIEYDVVPITLGKRILRTETAGLTVLSWIMYQLEQD